MRDNPLRVFLSHTSEFDQFPAGESFVAAARSGVERAGHLPLHMSSFPAGNRPPADYCRQQVEQADVYIAIVGFRYGSVVPEYPEISFVEFEFDVAVGREIPRLIFMLSDDALVPRIFNDPHRADRQERFRRRLAASGLLVKTFRTSESLRGDVFHALSMLQALPAARRDPSSRGGGRVAGPRLRDRWPGRRDPGGETGLDEPHGVSDRPVEATAVAAVRSGPVGPGPVDQASGPAAADSAEVGEAPTRPVEGRPAEGRPEHGRPAEGRPERARPGAASSARPSPQEPAAETTVPEAVRPPTARRGFQIGGRAWQRAATKVGGPKRLRVALIAGLMVIVVAATTVIMTRTTTDDGCPISTELRISVTGDIATPANDAAARLMNMTTLPHDCREATLDVQSLSSSGLAVAALREGWDGSGALHSLGPSPDALIVPSFTDWQRIERGIALLPRDSVAVAKPVKIATTPLVLAVPESWAQEHQLPSDGGEISLADVLRRAETRSDGSMHILRPNPESSAEGLVATATVYRAALGGASPKPADAISPADHRALLSAERVMDKIGSSPQQLLCELGGSAESAPVSSWAVALVPEQAVARYQAQPRGCDGQPGAGIRRLYLSDGTPNLDYQYMGIDQKTGIGDYEGIGRQNQSGTRSPVALAAKLGTVLLSPEVQTEIADAGFRKADGGVSPRAHIRAAAAPNPIDTATLIPDPDALLGLSAQLGRPARVALAVDVSPSMAQPTATGDTRLDTVRTAVSKDLALVAPTDELALQTFSRAGTPSIPSTPSTPSTPIVPLGKAGDGSRDGVRRELAGLRPAAAGVGGVTADRSTTALFAEVRAGIETLRSTPGADGTTNTMVVFTDADGPAPADGSAEQVGDLLSADGEGPAQLLVLALGEARCDQAGLAALVRAGAVCDASAASTGLGPAFDRIATGLWGVTTK